jgi:hypothetical protein
MFLRQPQIQKKKKAPPGNKEKKKALSNKQGKVLMAVAGSRLVHFKFCMAKCFRLVHVILTLISYAKRVIFFSPSLASALYLLYGLLPQDSA